jgi:hypothetical protein
MFLNYPRILFCYQSKNLEKKLCYLLEDIHLPFSMLVSNPVVLTYSLRRIKSRLEYVRLKAPTLIGHFNLVHWIKPNDKVFVICRLRQESLTEYNKFKIN